MPANQIVVPISTPVIPPGQEPTKPSLLNKPAEGVPFFTPVQDPPSGTAVDPQPDGAPIPTLFKPLTIRGVTFQNRIFVSPLCQYSCIDGFQQPWNEGHIGGIVSRGPGLFIVEATAVQSRGRISPEDSGIWLDAQIPGLAKHVQFAHSQNQKIGIQIAHAGRKASTVPPFLSFGDTAHLDANGWPDDVVGPSAIPFSDTFPKPREMTLREIEELKADFVRAAVRSVKAGFDVIEIHNAHGYLLHEFLSPVSNQRTDKYGGSFENRVRLTLEIVEGIRAAIPRDMPLFLRISATDWLEQVPEIKESWTLDQTVKLAPLLAERGVDLLDVSSGGQHPLARYNPANSGNPQIGFAKEVKKAVGDKMHVSGVGGIKEGKQAESVLNEGTPLDAVMVGRWFQKNPGLVWQFAEDLNISIYLASQIGWGFGGRSTRTSKK